LIIEPVNYLGFYTWIGSTTNKTTIAGVSSSCEPAEGEEQSLSTLYCGGATLGGAATESLGGCHV